MSVVEDVKSRLDIIDIISGYVNLQKAGHNYKALCPFHQERTPSFVVFPDTQTWRCFGACGEGGDVFSFVMKAEGWDFSEALRELAKRAGVELKPLTPQQVDQQESAERLLRIVQEAADFYHDRLLNGRDAEIAREYVRGRHLNRETVEAFQIGYAPKDWREAMQHLQLLGYDTEDILEAGIAIHNEDKNTTYDRFRHRLMIPIRDGRGQTVGFGARALDPNDRAKYINSPQGPLFDKSAILFGLDMARRAIRESETAIIVEGYMDVMQAYQAGFENVIAQMGTALTEPQLRQLDKYASRLVLALDPDTAGLNATMRGLNVARQTLDGEQSITFDPRGMMRYTGMLEMDIRVITLPEGKDPDALIREDPDAWRALIDRALPVADFVIRQGTAHLGKNASFQEREAAARELLPILTATESDLQRSGNIQALARELHLDERALMAWTQRRQPGKKRSRPSLQEQRRLVERPAQPPISSAPPGQSERREGFCLGLLLEQPAWLFMANRRLRELQGGNSDLAAALGPLCAEDFGRPDYQAIFRALEGWLYQDGEPFQTYLYRVLPAELIDLLDELRTPLLESLGRQLSGSLAVELQSIVRERTRINAMPVPTEGLFVQEALTLRLSRLEREHRELFFLQAEADREGNPMADQFAAASATHAQALSILTRALQQLRSLFRDA